MDQTENLSLPYLMPSQAQKHVTHNEALRALDAIVQLSVQSASVTSPPPSPGAGERYLVPDGATGDWAAHGEEVAAFQDGAWAYFSPQPGWRCYVGDTRTVLVWDGTGWAGAGGPCAAFEQLGINGAASGATNRLAVNAPAVLLNHDGTDHRLTLNKAAAADTVSVLFQTGFSGRAEFGLTGDDDWHVKLSPDGATWTEALVADTATGMIGVAGIAAPEVAVHVSGSVRADMDGPNPGFIAYRSDGGKSCAVGAGTGSAYFMFDAAGDFAIASQSSSSVLTGTAGGKTDRIVVDGTTGFVRIGEGTAAARLDVDGAVRAKNHATADRPSAASLGAGSMLYDITLAQPIWSDGTDWRDAAGVLV